MSDIYSPKTNPDNPSDLTTIYKFNKRILESTKLKLRTKLQWINNDHNRENKKETTTESWIRKVE